MAQGFRLRCEQVPRQRRKEISLDEARRLGATYCGGQNLPKTVRGLQCAKTWLYKSMDKDRRAYITVGHGMLAVWQSCPLEVHLYFGD